MFMSKPSTKLELLAEELVIFNPVGDAMLVSEALQDCEVLVESVSLSMDFLSLELQELDVILGMNFLYAHFSSINCHNKEVVFWKPGFLKVMFKGQRKVVPSSLILANLKDEKLLREWYTIFLAHVLVVQREKLRLEDVPIGRDYLDVFPKEISGLPIDRGMKFTIELLPGTTPYLTSTL
ncbi:Gag protease polyprotein-like protein [Cucumis melo var. makuwa]|uniref:Gag protease polyprotein-like protein n=1 Tax=Cucumis melo var. makuwa TaxID=1194695 RepID=A0A5A7SIY3_CUCMM|nr:Gag protease polyprotein-like protein [Cucumis melo var. makuwa]TYK11608.1 Gag protease polyprotein-like protein [Cucumis melo var. makuwa]